LNKNNYRLLKVVSEKLTASEKGFGLKKSRGQALINITEISDVFKVTGEEQVEIVMKNGNTFIVKNMDLGDLLQALNKLKDG
jgi:hypothetical protein